MAQTNLEWAPLEFWKKFVFRDSGKVCPLKVVCKNKVLFCSKVVGKRVGQKSHFVPNFEAQNSKPPSSFRVKVESSKAYEKFPPLSHPLVCVALPSYRVAPQRAKGKET